MIQLSMFDARAKAQVGIQRAADATERRHDGWCEQAVAALRHFALTHSEPFTIELARAAFEKDLPKPNDKRAFGTVTRLATSRGFIEKVPGVFFPAASSNGSPKSVYRAGAKVGS